MKKELSKVIHNAYCNELAPESKRFLITPGTGACVKARLSVGLPPLTERELPHNRLGYFDVIRGICLRCEYLSIKLKEQGLNIADIPKFRIKK